ncbi:uncharacterized protein BX663DRAFT_513724 [Cokeromyces recurvatus]|uniref:uncharacterized protein n=1 Tax=Cokeromyces recurvatus TaxID=90255 RepID=UPI00221E87F5|nr:uncharacterized protein BX663DRAFT_513724 [Cokeromyces recurvatus]KAI7901699.1 hypothetical protein BX663DRAFT_513724 [Cokeromyces recurvatus]
MENTNNSTANSNETKAPILCIAGCGFYGSEAFNNMCSKCFKERKTANEKNATNLTSSSSPPPPSSSIIISSPVVSLDDSNIIDKTRKHLRSPSPDNELKVNSAPGSSIASPAATTPDNNEKPIQTNKGRCFKCRSKVPLAKQAANKCRCGYIFCDSHRYPDRHDCDIDYAKLDREILAKNNPKLHERPKGGRSFQRLDSL